MEKSNLTEEEVKQKLIKIYTNYFGSDFYEIIKNRIEGVFFIPYTYFSIRSITQSNGTFNPKYIAELNRINSLIKSKLVEQNIFRSKQEIDECIAEELGKKNLACFCNLSQFNVKDNKIVYSECNFVYYDKNTKHFFSYNILHEGLHCIAQHHNYTYNANVIYFNHIGGFLHRNYITKIDKNNVHHSTITESGSALNEYITEKTARVLHEKYLSRGYKLNKSHQNTYKSAYLFMDKIGNKLFKYFGKDLYKYAITDDEKYLKNKITQNELNALIKGFDFYFDNLIDFLDYRQCPEYKDFCKTFRENYMCIKKLVNMLVDRYLENRQVK